MQKHHSNLATLLSLGCSVLGILWGSAVWANAGKTQTPTPAELEAQLEKWPPQLVIDSGGHSRPVWDVMFSPEGNKLYSTSLDKTVQVWDVRKEKRQKVFRFQRGTGSKGELNAGALSPDGEKLAVGFSDNNIRIIDANTGVIKKTLYGHKSRIGDIKFFPDGRHILSSSMEVRIWDLKTGKTKHILKDAGRNGGIMNVAISPSGNHVAASNPWEPVRLWDARNGNLISRLNNPRSDTFSLAFSPKGRYLVTNADNPVGEGNGLALWNSKTGSFVKIMAVSRVNRQVRFFLFNEEGGKLIVGRERALSKQESKYWIEVFSFPEGERLDSFGGPPKRVFNTYPAAAWDGDSNLVATGGHLDDGAPAIQVWDAANGTVKKFFRDNGQGYISQVGFSKDGSSVAWGVRENKEHGYYNKHGDLKYQLDLLSGQKGKFSNVEEDKGFIRGVRETKGRGLSFSDEDRFAKKWLEVFEYGSPKIKIKADSWARSGRDFVTASLTPSGKTVLIGGRDGRLVSYNANSGEKLQEFVGHGGYVLALAPSPDGRLLVSGSSDQTIRLWEIATGELLVTIFPTRDGEWVAWTPEGFFDASEHGA
ncbi:WD40 repeat domain-containing protein, partial [Thiohalorhabdus methylotrophus]